MVSDIDCTLEGLPQPPGLRFGLRGVIEHVCSCLRVTPCVSVSKSEHIDRRAMVNIESPLQHWNTPMALELYGHPFAAFAWKPLIAAYELQIPFVFRMVDPEHPENLAKMAELSPTGQFPALVDGDQKITQSNAVVEYLDRLGKSERLIPTEPLLALRARMLADVFDDYVAGPMQQIVAEALRPKEQQDPRRVAEAKAKLDMAYDWLSQQIKSSWAVADTFTIGDCAATPALFYADWVHAIPAGNLKDYRTRLLKRPSVVRTVNEARPYRKFFPLGAPDRD